MAKVGGPKADVTKEKVVSVTMKRCVTDCINRIYEVVVRKEGMWS